MADTRIDELRRRLERDPGSRMFAQLAEELRKGGDLAEAIRVARAGLAVHAAYPSARLTLGRALLDSGDAEGARGELESALRDAPDNIQASRYLAQAREKLGDLKGAAEQYRKTLLMAPGDRQLQAALATVEAQLAAHGAPAQAAGETRPPEPPPAPSRPAAPAAGSGPAGPRAAPAPAAPTAAPRAPAPPPLPRGEPVVFAPTRPAAPAPPDADEGAGTPGVLPPTLRIHAPQMPAEPPAEPATLPGGRTSAEAVRASAEDLRAAATDAIPVTRPAPPPPAPAPAPPAPPPPPAAPAPPPPPTARAPVAAEPERARAEPAPDGAAPAPLASSTLAELYLQQGLAERARDVYQQLLVQEPGNRKARERLAELEAQAAAAADPSARRRALERTIAGLEAMLAAVRRR